MEQNFERLRVGGKNNKLGLATVEGLCGFVGSLFQLLVIDSLLQDVQDCSGELGRGERVCLWVCFVVGLKGAGEKREQGGGFCIFLVEREKGKEREIHFDSENM